MTTQAAVGLCVSYTVGGQSPPWGRGRR